MNRDLRVRRFAVVVLATVLTVAASSWVQAVEPINTNRRGVALAGYDPVAYFTEGKPVKGSSDHAYEWSGATWRFASAEHREAFAAAPERYAPQYGGYCAWAASENQIADIDPSSWKIVEGKLYLNYSLKVQKTWEEDIPGRIARADANWPELLSRK